MRVIKEDGTLTEDDSATATQMNKTLASIFIKEDPNEILPETNYSYSGSILSELIITEEMVLNVLKKLNINKSAGPDNISPRLLKKCCKSLVRPLTIIFNKSLQTGDVPTAWKEANVTPLFKKGDKTNPLNYRPVSLTSVVGKVFETIIRDALVKHATENAIIKIQQHGFMKKKSTLTNLLEYLNVLTKAKDLGIPVDINYLDFSKAFDLVDHNLLINKCIALGVRPSVIAWIASFLEDREQCVRYRGHKSEWVKLKGGVPQGTRIGPHGFVTINDAATDNDLAILKYV